MHPSGDALKDISSLVDGWCERRCLRPLSYVLQAWPLASPLTDAWGELLTELERVRAFARADLTPDELERVERAISAVGRIVHR